ncbi:MAG: pyruvate kinase [Verrucomicrobia bacterium]|nr:pyruvate kinase [Verrucomicrobiota bacterium]
MQLPLNKTRIVCTIGPASSSPEVLRQMIRAGMNVARLNFSHGDFATMRDWIQRLRAAARAEEQRLAILADLPGPKMRIGTLAREPIELEPGAPFTLTTAEAIGDEQRACVTFAALPKVVKAGDALYLNDGLIQLRVEAVAGLEVRCRVGVGGELRSRKGLNLPGIDLGMSAFTERDHECLRFALAEGVDVVSQSFVQSADDVHAVRAAAAALGGKPLVIAKIERASALDCLDAILAAADGLMIARGDLGVEVPIERIALVQKQILHRANWLGKPVITATQMLESMTQSRLPTRAEATDVANAILDGTDGVMLSGESALGRFPVAAVAMLARIAAATEPHRRISPVREALRSQRLEGQIHLRDLIARAVEDTFEHVTPAAVLVPTLSGATALSIARFRLPAWIVAVTPNETTCQQLQLSYGVRPVHALEPPEDWSRFGRQWVQEHQLEGDFLVLTEGPSSKNPHANHRVEIIDLRPSP